jgi:phosphoadenosine phosphosulfate reductase
MSIEEATEEALNFLKETIGSEQAVVNFSGGKDSIVIEKLAKMSGIDYVLVNTITGIDPPQVLRFIRRYYPHCLFVRPKKSFWDLILTHNPPGGSWGGIKWCCLMIKENPSDKRFKQKFKILGIRKEESFNRSGRDRVGNYRGKVWVYPIFEWKEWHVWEFIEKYKLPYPRLYDQGFDRLGCVICPDHSLAYHKRYREKYPNHFKCFEKYVMMWWHKRKAQGRDMFHENVQGFLRDWYRGRAYLYKGKYLEKGIFKNGKKTDKT